MDILNIGISVMLFGTLSLLLAVAICVFSKLFYVKDDPRQEEVLDKLPGVNCGGCGYPGCSGFAKAIIERRVDPAQCKPIKKENIDIIRNYIDKTTGPTGEFIEKDA